MDTTLSLYLTLRPNTSEETMQHVCETILSPAGQKVEIHSIEEQDTGELVVHATVDLEDSNSWWARARAQNLYDWGDILGFQLL